MKTFLTLFAFFVLSQAWSQTLIRWDFENDLGNPTLLPTLVSDTSLEVNSVAYSNLYPLTGNFVSGVSGQTLDWSSSVRGWYPDSSVQVYQNTWIEFRFYVDTNVTLSVDSVSMWCKTEDIGPKRFDFRSHKDLYGSQLSAILLGSSDTSWFRWSIPLNSFVCNGYEQVTFRIYGDGAPSEYEGFFTIDSVAIFGQVSQLKQVPVKAFLSGPWNGIDMDDDLRVQGLVPLTDPYGFGKTTTVDVLAVTGSNAIVDWVLISLRSPLDSTQVVYEAPFLLQRDGDVVALDGISSPLLPGGDYYISVSHRNHLGVMTATLVQDSVDFTNPATPVTGTESRVLVGDKALLWSGDASGNGVVKYTGSGNDRDPILVAIGGSVPTNTVSGYFNTDVNMDGVVKYTGSGNDRDFILLNVGGSVPTNTRISGIP